MRRRCRRRGEATVAPEGPVPRILAAQQADGHFCERDRFYTAKYRGTVWTLLILAELGADGADARVRTACEAVLRDAQDPDSGGFSTGRSKKAGGGLHSMVIPCLTGNLVFRVPSASACWTTRACSGPSTGSPPASASTTPRARRPPAGPTTGWRCVGAATPATWAR